jgi:hypothetical protein
MKRFLLLLLVSIYPTAAVAELVEKYAPIYIDTAEPNMFFLFGEIDSRTVLNFDRAIEEFGIPSVLILSSDGGLVDQGLNVARAVHKHGIDTLIPEDAGCYSACALVFLAGKARVANGALGVHQISSASNNLSSGQVAISDILDVLGNFNVPNDLLVDMFRTAPEEMHVLTFEEKMDYGFTLRSPDEQNLRQPVSQESAVLDLLLRYNEAWSKPNETALREVMGFYEDDILFYGKTFSASDLLREKQAFAVRWPVRKYSVDRASVTISCADDFCTASANVSWVASSPERAKTSSGVAFFQLGIRFMSGVPRIIAEDGQVLSRSP